MFMIEYIETILKNICISIIINIKIKIYKFTNHMDQIILILLQVVINNEMVKKIHSSI